MFSEILLVGTVTFILSLLLDVMGNRELGIHIIIRGIAFGLVMAAVTSLIQNRQIGELQEIWESRTNTSSPEYARNENICTNFPCTTSVEDDGEPTTTEERGLSQGRESSMTEKRHLSVGGESAMTTEKRGLSAGGESAATEKRGQLAARGSTTTEKLGVSAGGESTTTEKRGPSAAGRELTTTEFRHPLEGHSKSQSCKRRHSATRCRSSNSCVPATETLTSKTSIRSDTMDALTESWGTNYENSSDYESNGSHHSASHSDKGIPTPSPRFLISNNRVSIRISEIRFQSK